MTGAVSFVVLIKAIDELVSVTVEDGTRVRDSVVTVFLTGAVSLVVLVETIEELVSATVEDGTRVRDSVFLSGAVLFVGLVETIEVLVSVTVEDGTRVRDSVVSVLSIDVEMAVVTEEEVTDPRTVDMIVFDDGEL